MKPKRMFRRLSAGGASTCRVKGVENKEKRKVLDCFIVSESLANRMDKVEVVEEYGSKPHKQVRCDIISLK